MRMTLHRADAIHFEVAIFTNLTQDHLDFHADMEDYFLAKRKLFEAGPKTAIVNVDDPYGRRLAEEFECVTFSAEGAEADYSARDVSFDAGGARFRVGEMELRTGLPGHFNVANALGAFAAAEAMGVGAEIAAAGLARAARVPGRFEPIDEGQGFSVLVDYAHTPDSLENVLRAARRLTSGRLISVFGAGGDRDRDKRPKMGRAGAELSDLAVDHLRQPALRGPGGDRRRSRRRRRRRCWRRRAGGRRRPPRGDRPGAGAGRAGRHRRDRRQGPRAGPGIRGRAEDPLRRPRGRPRGALEAGQPGVKLTPEEIAAAMGAEILAEGEAGSPRRAVIDSGDAGPGTSSSACAAPTTTAASSPRPRSRPGPGARSSVPRRRTHLSPHTGDKCVRRAGSSSSRTRWRRCRRWPAPGGARSARGSSGSPARSARPRSRTSPGRSCPAGPRQPGEPQHRDRAAADDPRSARRRPRRWSWRWRCVARARSPNWRRSPSPRWR